MDRYGRPTIGVLLGWHDFEETLHGFPGPAVDGIISAARARDCNLLLACGVSRTLAGVSQPTRRPAWFIPSPECDFVPVGPWNTDGLIIRAPLPSRAMSHDVRRAIADGHPVVFLGPGEDGPTVAPDDEGGIHQAVAHLVAHGHRRIAFIARALEDIRWPGGRRLGAYRAAIREHGLTPDPALVVPGSSVDGGRRAMRRILDSGAPFTAVLASDDGLATGAMQALEEVERQVPGDVAVVGFGNRIEAEATEPGLTTIHVPWFEVGHAAMDLLLDLVAGGAPGVEVITPAARLTVRGSCGCRPEDLLHGMDPADGQAVVPRIARAMAAAVAGRVHRLPPDQIGSLCERLVETLVSNLEQSTGSPFHQVLGEALRCTGTTGDDVSAWSDALLILKSGAPELVALLEPGARNSAERFAGDVLFHALATVGERARRRRAKQVRQSRDVDDHAERVTARFFAAPDEAQAFGLLQELASQVGAGRVEAAIFEPEGDDPVAWSVPRTEPAVQRAPARFPSRSFPPEGLYPDDEPFHLALLPLAIREGDGGFVALDAVEDARFFAPVVTRLAAALGSARQRRKALEGWHLAEEASHLKTLFLSMVGHELRTPLNLIVGLSEMLLEENGEVETPSRQVYWEDTRQIHTSARHLDELIRDVLDLARCEMGRLQLVREPLDLAEALQPVVVLGEQMARHAGLEWRVDFADCLPPVWGDRDRLRQVVLNLVSNAAKFTSEGEVALEVGIRGISDLGFRTADGTVRDSGLGTRDPGHEPATNHASRSTPHATRSTQHVPQAPDPASQTEPYVSRLTSYAPDAPVIVVSISDTGLGIPPAEQETIFDEFRQPDRPTMRAHGAFGLRLAVCRRLVELHGGEISVRSSEGEGAGATFSFTLPAVESASLSTTDTPVSPEIGRQTVLLLAERIESGEALRQHLVRQGFEVQVIDTTHTPGWLARLLAAPPGAVVLDMEMASEQGWEILKILKGSPGTQDIPVLFYSLAHERDSGSVLAMDYMIKPVSADELARALEQQGLAAGEGRERTVLVVDDEPQVVEMYARMVQSQFGSCRVLTARDGREALELLRRRRPDLVLLDLMMPELDGFGVLEAMQEDEALQATPVIVLTGQVLAEEDLERLNRGVAVVLKKGVFSAEETLAHVEAALARRPGLGSETRRLVRKAMAYIHEHYGEPISRGDVADYVGLHPDYLTRCFSQEMDLSLTAYLNRYRVDQAKVLLKTSKKKITEIAELVGFADSNYFSRVFRQEAGMSPSAYRRT